MFKSYENRCVDCDIPCTDCGLKRVPVFVCDRCGKEDKLYNVDGEQQLCEHCLREVMQEYVEYESLDTLIEVFEDVMMIKES